MFYNIIGILTIPIFILNFGGGIIGGVWLAILGEWRLIGIGVLLLLSSHWLIAILMIPILPLSALSFKLYEKKNILGYLFGFLSQFLQNLLVIATCCFAFYVCSSFYYGNIDIGYIPYLLWSWGMALGPWQFFTSQDPDNEFAAIFLLCASVFYFLFLVGLFINSLLALIIVVLFGFVQLIVLPIVCLYFAKQMDEYV